MTNPPNIIPANISGHMVVNILLVTFKMIILSLIPQLVTARQAISLPLCSLLRTGICRVNLLPTLMDGRTVLSEEPRGIYKVISMISYSVQNKAKYPHSFMGQPVLLSVLLIHSKLDKTRSVQQEKFLSSPAIITPSNDSIFNPMWDNDICVFQIL